MVLLTIWVLSSLVRLYPTVKVTGKSFIGVKRVTVPNQSMSLREIVQRFIRREPLPMSKEGLYEERFGDLEKLSKEDIVIQLARAKELKSQIAGFNDRQKAKADAVVAKDLADREASLLAKSARVEGAASVPASGGVV